MHIRWQRNRDILYSPGSVVKMHLHVSWNMYVERELWVFSPESSGDLSLRNSDRIESGMLGKIYKWGFPTKRRSLAVDRQRGARYFIVSSLLAIPSPLCTRISYLLRLRIAMDVARGTTLNLAFIVNGTGRHPHCDGNSRDVKKKLLKGERNVTPTT